MATQILARRIRRDLYRIDPSQIASDYIGEAAKKVSSLLESLEGSVILLDEADALLGEPGTQGAACGRHRNPEADSLWQLFEEHLGVVVLAVDGPTDIDPAVLRRLDVIVNFPMPSAEDRLKIWRRSLWKQTLSHDGVDLRFIARKFELTGGSIRNAVLVAAYCAAVEGEPATMRHLTAAILRELNRPGRDPSGQNRLG